MSSRIPSRQETGDRRESGGDDPIERARRAGVLSFLDQHFAHRLALLFGEVDPAVRFAAALACRQESLGHVCADLGRLGVEGLASDDGVEASGIPVLLPHVTLEAWLAAIAASPLVESVAMKGLRTDDPVGADGHVVERTAEPRPLVLDGEGRLYLRRLHRAEGELAKAVLRRVARPDIALAEFDAPGAITQVLADRLAAGDEAPRRALEIGLTRPLSILTGGPGTGKTTLVACLVRLLALQALETNGRAPRVLLLAPTGKAAAAMANSFARERAVDGLAEDLREALPTRAETIHRALLRRTRRAGSDAVDPDGFDADIVVVDEVSMVDLEQMTRLFAACEAVPRVVLLGDPRQLASVEAGAVLADLCGDAAGQAPVAGLERSIVRLTKSHRYRAAGGIGRLAEAVRAGDSELALEILSDPRHPDVERREIESLDQLGAELSVKVRRQQQALVAAETFEAKLARLLDYRVLCAHRRGPFGVESLARLLDESAALARRTSSRAAEWPGRLILVTQNAPDQGLWNGDVGIIERLQDRLCALFADPDGRARTLSLARLPTHESAIAMSVHKSQGSEFDQVDLVLGARVSRLMTRELVYTGITRARAGLRIHASEEVLRAAIARRARRDSGLVDRLRVG